MAAERLDVLLIFNKSGSSFPGYTWMIARDGLVSVDVMAPTGHAVLSSRWCRSHFSYESEQDFASLLETRLRGGRYRAVLCIDESSRKLFFKHRKQDWLEPYLPFPKDSELFEACGDKVLFQQWCEKNGVPAPIAKFAASADEVFDAAEEIGYPFMLKGAVGSRGIEVHLVQNREMVEGVLAASSHQKSWLLQEFIEGPVGSTSIVVREGKIYGICSSYKHMALRGGMGPSAMRRFVSNQELVRVAERVAEAGQMSGITGYDWMEVRPGEYRVIDPHLGRGPSSVLVSHYNDVDMCRAFYSSLTGADPEPLPTGEGKVIWVMPQMIRILFEGGILRALKKANPMCKGTSIFWCGKGEWHVLLRVAVPYMRGQIRICLGRLRALLTGRNVT